MSESTRGQGGAYVIDPKTGERQLEERTEPLAPMPAAPADPAAARKTTKMKD